MKKANLSLSSESSNSENSIRSKNSSTASLANSSNLANEMQKSCETLNDLIELHYFPYNSCNSLTIYSYKYWSSQKKFLVATKENNLKEIFFKTCFGGHLATDESRIENTGIDSILSARSSVSSSNSNHHQLLQTLAQQANQNDELNEQGNRKSSIINSTMMTDDKSTYSGIEYEYSYLDPVLKVHKFSKIKSKTNQSHHSN